MHSCEVHITNALGLHAKASAAFVRLANQFRASITVEVNGKRANGKSIMGLLMLAASRGTRIRIMAQGEDAEEALDSLNGLVANKFGEEE